MAQAGTAAAKPGIRNSGFWLIVVYAATVFWVLDARWRDAILEAFLENWWLPLAILVGWSVAGGVLGSVMRATGGGKAPGWVFLVNGWLVATLAAGIVLPLLFAEARFARQAVEGTIEGLVTLAILGAIWVAVVDLSRLGLWRLSRRPAPPLLAVATLAALAGLVVVAAVVQRHLDGELGRPPLEGAVIGLALVTGSAFLLTLLLELPRALMQRSGAEARPRGVEGLRRAWRSAASRTPSSGETIAVRPRSRAHDLHGTTYTPPTVVRRR